MIAVKTPSIAAAEETRRGEQWREEKRREPELDRTCSSRDSCIQRGRGEIDSPNLRKDEDEDEDGHIEVLQCTPPKANQTMAEQRDQIPRGHEHVVAEPAIGRCIAGQ